MKNEESKELDPMRRWISEAGTENPGNQFHLSVLKKIEGLAGPSTTYSPVISAFCWKIIFGFIASIFVWCALFVPPSTQDSALFEQIPKVKLPVLDLSIKILAFPTPELSSNLLLGIGAFFLMGMLLILSILYDRHAKL